MIATYHNHTTWSDGQGTIDEMIDGAVAHGVDELGLSDHLWLDPHGSTREWAMSRRTFDDYVTAMQAAQRSSPLPLRIGAEIDWFPGQAEALAAILDAYPLDYRIGAVHELPDFVIDWKPAIWEALSEDDRNEKHRKYWVAIASLAESGLFDIVAHIDLPKKFGYYATADLSQEIAAALDAIADAGLVVELNTAGWHKPCGDGYPTPDILEACRARDIPTTISADAHHPDHLLRDFGRAADRLRAAGYSTVARFAERSYHLEPLESAVAVP